MKTLLLCSDTTNNRALANRLAEGPGLFAIGLIDLPKPKKRASLLTRVTSFSLGRPLRKAWFGMLASLGREYPTYPFVLISRHEGVNSPSVIKFVREVQPDLTLVSGTDLLRKPIIEVLRESGEVMNLHTGLSPYIKGGPNCTNWALATNRFEFIGNTVMWIDEGIDSGAIIATEQTPVDGSETIEELHRKVMDHAHELYVRAVARHAAGGALNRVAQQDVARGTLYLTRDWRPRHILAALTNFRRAFRPGNQSIMSPVRTVPLDRPYPVSSSE